MLHRLLLGPQRPITNLGDAVKAACIPEGPIAVISAGWQEAEADIDDVNELVPGPLHDLKLYHRAEAIFAADTHLRSAYRQRQDRLQELQGLYRLRLHQLTIAARQMQRSTASPDLAEIERQHSLAQLRSLDQHHLRRIESVFAEFADDLGPERSAVLAEHLDAVKTVLAGCATVLITGGNVLVLLNRLQLFAMHSELASRHLIAWSAGAMVLGEVIVLYHDRMPLGRRDPELLGAGMGIFPDHLFLPDARKRLLVKDPVRMRLMSGRFAPAQGITLNSGSVLHFHDSTIHAAQGIGYLTETGAISVVSAP